MSSIEIYIKNLNNQLNININLSENKIKINSKEKNVTNVQIDNLFRIIRTWNKNYYKDNTIDEEKFIIKIVTDNEIDIINGKGSYPENYNEFKKWIGEFND